MKFSPLMAACGAALCLGALAPRAEAAKALVVRVPTGAPRIYIEPNERARPPRVRPSSYVKRYPFGDLREDYTPYGMPGVPARLYFDRMGKGA